MSGLLSGDGVGTSGISEAEVRVGDLRFDVLECGPPDGDVVMLLHGFPQSAATWRQLLPLLGDAGWHAIAMSQRGYSAGARPHGRSAYRIDRLVADVLGVATVRGIDRFHVVGHDWGGVVAWSLAAAHPDRLWSVTSLATPHPQAMARSMVGLQALRSVYAAWFQLPLVPELSLAAREGALLRSALSHSGLSDRWVQDYASAMDPDTLHAALQWYRATPPWQLAATGAIDVPTLYVWGNGDTALGRAAAERTEDHVEAPYRFEELKASHWLPEDHSVDVGGHLLAHLDAHRGER